MKMQDYLKVLDYLNNNSNVAKNLTVPRISRYTSFPTAKVNTILILLYTKHYVNKIDNSLTKNGEILLYDLRNVIEALE